MKILSAETNLGSLTTVSTASVVRLFNSGTDNILVTRKDYAGTVVGSFMVPAGQVVYCEKYYTDLLEGGADVKATKVAYSSMMSFVSSGSSGPSYTYSVSASSVDEGGNWTTTVTTTNVDDNTTLYWELSGTGITSADFSSGALTGSGTISNNTFNFSHTVANDTLTEGTETVTIKLYTDSGRNTQVGNTVTVTLNDTSTTPPAGQIYWEDPGTYTWTPPVGVTEISIVCVGAGGGTRNPPAGGAGGADLRWRNGISVSYGTNYVVTVGLPGGEAGWTSGDGGAGGSSMFGTTGLPNAYLVASGGYGYKTSGYDARPDDSHGIGGAIGGGNGGNGGGTNGWRGGGGAGGYSGNGGSGFTGSWTIGSGGGGAGGSGSNGGGGVGIFGEGDSGTENGEGGSGGGNSTGNKGGKYGGGASEGRDGGKGAVRIIWGSNRSFPSTNTGNM